MRFIHIADVHLGMQPDAGFPWSEERGEAIWESFRRIIRLAGREKTDFLLIAGDLFQRQPLLRELKEVNDLFASIPETIVVLIAGNHDYVKRESFYRGFDWADNVVMLLSPEPECVEVPEKKTAVYGCSYDKKEILENRLDGVREELREASLALGATPIQTIFKVIIPAARSGIVTGVILGIGRAIGETMAIIMVCGNVANMPNLFKSVRFLTTGIASEMSYAGGLHREVLFSIGLVLFIFIMVINIVINRMFKKQKNDE